MRYELKSNRSKISRKSA